VGNVRRIVFGANPRRTTVRILVLTIASAITFGWILVPVRADGDSMLPTYYSGNLSLVNRMAYFKSGPHRGDVVAIRLAGRSVVYIKRIIALPGERLAVVEGDVMINGQSLFEPYVRHRRAWDVQEITLGPREYFVVGDNRGTSDFGSVQADKIVGRLMF
jgi:signal peptidase I